MAQWEGLHHDLLVLIVEKLNLIEDFPAFALVCKSWHVAADTTKPSLRRSQAPWLIFPVREAEDDRQVFTLSKHDRLTKNIYIPEMHNKLCIGLNYGWFLISSLEGDIKLVHPLSRAQILLPSQQYILPAGSVLSSSITCRITRAAMSANPSESPLDFVLMIACAYRRHLYYWRPGHKSWTTARERWGYVESVYDDVSYHDNQFYAINRFGQVWSWTDLGPHQDPIFISYVTERRYSGAIGFHSEVDYYVVPGSAPGSVFVVICFRDEVEYTQESLYITRIGCPAKHMKMWFQVHELNLMNRGCSEIKSLGDRAIFVGCNTSMALENASQYLGVKPNHVYFTNDCIFGGEKEVGWYNIEDGEITHFGVDTTIPFRHFWFIPSF